MNTAEKDAYSPECSCEGETFPKADQRTSTDRRNPVLIVLHGGPGNVDMPMSWWFGGWEKHLTVVYWDQRGEDLPAHRSCDRRADSDPGEHGRRRRGTSSAFQLRRWGEPEDIAKAVRILASDDSSYVNTIELIVDSGATGARLGVSHFPPLKYNPTTVEPGRSQM